MLLFVVQLYDVAPFVEEAIPVAPVAVMAVAVILLPEMEAFRLEVPAHVALAAWPKPT